MPPARHLRAAWVAGVCLVAIVAAAAPSFGAVNVRAWKPTGATRFLLQCVADAVIDLPTCASVNDGFDCRVLATNALYLCDGAGSWTAVGGGGGGVSDGDKGDVTVSGSGSTWTIDADSVALGTDTTGNYAGSSSEGGAATDLSCSDCIGGAEIDESSLVLSGGLTHPQIMARLAVGGGY
jgi:hypothetical protein